MKVLGRYPPNVKQIAHYLIIQNITIGDTGYYTCSAKNRAGLDIKTVHVLVNATNPTLVAPVIIASSDVIVNLDTEAVIVCNVTGYPTPDIKWVYDHDKNISTVLISGGSLRIPNATSEASGLYTCIASNDAGSAKAFVFLYVVHGSIPPRVAPVITTSPHVIVNYYTEAEIICNVTGFPTPHITWEYDQIMKGLTVLISGGTLPIPNATNEASGLYTCIASNDAGSAKAFVRLEVVHDPSYIFSPPEPFSGSAGVSQNISCKVSGHPQPTITWKFTSFTRQTSVLPAHTLFENGEVLEISNLQESGIISCKAINEFGKDEASAHVIVHHDSAVFG
ncbi:putative oxidoreductase PXDNL [Mytilus galloprovincialis]|uniref:putative oxidoreductase PXDNL n=1 Tax=Mytilus galloprovincialis TaxID=29158 RepID=UPI003F7BC000